MLNCKIIGEGKTNLVLLHGFCENNTCFDKQVLLFKDHCKVIIPDLPGFGQSDTYDNMSISSMAKDIHALLQFLQIKDCVMIGHSMGGYVTLSFEQQFSDMLLGFGLLHSTAAEDSPERKEKRNQVVDFIRSQGKKAYIESFIPGLYSPGNRSKSYVREAIEVGLNTDAKGIIHAALAMRDRPNLQSLLGETEKPVYFGIGAEDELIPSEIMLHQAASCQKAFVTLFEKTAHMAMEEEPENLAHSILSYLKTFNFV